jgi:hypothetical protein
VSVRTRKRRAIKRAVSHLPTIDQQPAEVPPGPRPDPVVEPLKLPDPVVAGGIAVWLVPAVGLFADSPPVVTPGVPATAPHGRPSASVRPMVFGVPVMPPVEGLVWTVPAAGGVVPMVPGGLAPAE